MRPNVAYPSWLRLQRIGNTIYYYYGTNGTNWTYWTSYDSTTSLEGALPATLQVGLALTSHDSARTGNGVMASFTAINDGALNFTLQPTNTTVVEGATAVFRAAAGGNSPYFYQWLKRNRGSPRFLFSIVPGGLDWRPYETTEVAGGIDDRWIR